MLDVCKLYDLMEEKGVKSLVELSRKTRIPYTTLHYMTTGHDMYTSNILMLARFFDVTIESLIYNTSYIVTYYNKYKKITHSADIFSFTLKEIVNSVNLTQLDFAKYTI